MEQTMTSFNKGGGDRDPEEWQKLAFRNASEDSSQIKFIGTFVAAGLAGIMASPATGLLIGGLGLYWTIKGVHDKGRARTAVQRYGMVAPFLDENDFKDYARQVLKENGAQVLIDELLEADENGFDLPDAAYEIVEKHAPHLLEGNKQPMALSASTTVNTFSINNSIDIVNQLTERIGNALIIGTPGSGKGMLIANCIRAAKAKHPDLKVFVIDPKADPEEMGYWEGAADVLESYACERASPESVVTFLEESFEKYYQYWEKHRRVLLILDEGTLIGSKAKTAKSDAVKNFVVAVASAGDSQGRNIWLTSLSPFVGDLGINLNASSQLTAVAIVREVGVLKQWSKASTIEKADASTIQTLIDESECKRAVYSGVTGQWHSMPKLHNYSAKNRDERKPNGDALSSQQREELRSRTATATPKTQAQTIIQQLEKTTAKSLAEFVYEELKCDAAMVEKTCKIILQVLKDEGREDLLDKFPVVEPLEEIRKWVQDLGRRPTPAELKVQWLKLTGKHLSDRAVTMLLENLGFKD